MVSKHEQNGVPERVFCQHPHKLLSGLVHTLSVIAVNHEDESLCALEVVGPQRPDRVLAAHTVRLMFLYSTVSTLKPVVGMVVTISPSFSLYRMVVLPAASRPTMRMRISFLPKRPLKRFAKIFSTS